MKRITTLLGARPQFVKASAMSRAFAVHGRIAERIVHTGQHFDVQMSDTFFRELEIPAPARNLAIANLPHGAMTGRMIEAIESDLMEHRPDAVMVYGDTNTTLAGALAAAKLALPVIHVEAGMRSGRTDVAEEINRIATDHVSHLLLCSSRQAIRHLEREGLGSKAQLVGDLMYDVALFARAKAGPFGLRTTLGLKPGAYSVLTLHRAENTNSTARLSQLIAYARNAADGREIVFPLHPRTDAFARAEQIPLDGMTLTPPLGYFDFHELLADAAQVLTDSGGVQKEAYFHRKPCVTLRDETEWTETIDAGWNRLWTQSAYITPRSDIPDYGDGAAAAKILNAIEALFST